MSISPKFPGWKLAVLLLIPWLTRMTAGTALADPGVRAGEDFDWNKAREFWSFRAPQAQALPGVANKRWVRQRMDRFILAAMEKRRLSPSLEADRRTLVRRVTFDLTGLPPTPTEINGFLSDARPDAYERLVERLLASPRYGERMASLWLNVARYAEDQAHQVGDDTKSFYPNAWRYRSWVIGAFNRDLPYDRFIKLQLAADKVEGATNELAALGFIGLGPKYYNRNRLDVMADEWEDRVDTVTRSFLGLTVACARCHDHKYDPITMRDYYALAGVFASTKLVDKALDGKQEPPVKDSEETGGKKGKPRENPDTMHVVDEDKAQDLNVFLRGNVERKGPVAERRFLQILCDDKPKAFTVGSGREELAAAIANPANPLTARVMVNRAWTLLFGHGLVGTPSNFGSQGSRPTHPELLDDLAVRFVENGWSVKWLMQEMVLSATYRQNTRLDATKQAIDPDNELLWRMNRRRLPVEMWRDAILAVTGELESGNEKSLELDDPKNLRRTVYARISRLKLNDVLMQFDYPDANVHAEKRSVTTTATQKLFVLNSPFMLSRAGALATRLIEDPDEADRARIGRAYEILYGRPASPAETRLALDFLGKPNETGMPRWEQYAQMLMAANEMIYLD